MSPAQANAHSNGDLPSHRSGLEELANQPTMKSTNNVTVQEKMEADSHRSSVEGLTRLKEIWRNSIVFFAGLIYSTVWYHHRGMQAAGIFVIWLIVLYSMERFDEFTPDSWLANSRFQGWPDSRSSEACHCCYCWLKDCLFPASNLAHLENTTIESVTSAKSAIYLSCFAPLRLCVS